MKYRLVPGTDMGIPKETASLEAARLLDEGRSAILENRLLEGIPLMERASAADPLWDAPLVNLAIIYRRLGDLPHALEAAMRATTVVPDSYMAFNQLGLIHLCKRKYKRAVAALEKAHSLAPMNVTIIVNLAIVYRRLKDSQRAISAYTSLLKSGNADVGVLHNLSVTYLDAGQLRQAIYAELSALKTLPREMRHYSYLSSLFLRLSRFRCASRFAFAETCQNPLDFNPYLLLGRIARDRFGATGDLLALNEVQTHLGRAQTMPRSPRLAIKVASWIHRFQAKALSFGAISDAAWRIGIRFVPKWDPADDIRMLLLGSVVLPTAILWLIVQSLVITVIGLISLFFFSVFLATILFSIQLALLLTTAFVLGLAYWRLTIQLRSAITDVAIPSEYPIRQGCPRLLGELPVSDPSPSNKTIN